MYGDYKAKFGAHPAPDTDPTADQISGLKQLVATGALPYVDFSVWTPHGLRHLRKQVFTVMGALDRAEYRSAELYLWTAKSIHIERGHEWTAQLIQAARRAKAACKRGRGPAKQAQPLPLSDLHRISDQLSPFVKHGPCHPVRSTVLVSWWLLREIEASFAKVYNTSSLNID